MEALQTWKPPAERMDGWMDASATGECPGHHRGLDCAPQEAGGGLDLVLSSGLCSFREAVSGQAQTVGESGLSMGSISRASPLK